MKDKIIFTSIEELPLLEERTEITEYEIRNDGTTYSIVIKIKAGTFRIRPPYSLIKYCGDGCSGPNSLIFVKCRRKKEDGSYLYSLFMHNDDDIYVHTKNLPYKPVKKKQQKKLNLITLDKASKKQLKKGKKGLSPLTKKDIANLQKQDEERYRLMEEDINDPLVSMTHMASWNNDR